MFKSYLKSGIRNLIRNKTYAFVNIFGMAVAIASLFFMVLYIQDELSYDKFNKNFDKIFRLVEDNRVDGGRTNYLATTPGALVPAVVNEFASIRSGVRLYQYSAALSNREQNKIFQEDRFFYADSTVLEIFSFHLTEGNPETVLDNPFSLVISESAAKKYFGNENPVGKVLTFEDEYDFVVTGILKDISYNSHIRFDFLASFSSVKIISPWIENWSWPPMYSYILASAESIPADLEAQIQSIAVANLSQDETEIREFHLQPLKDIHLHSQREFEPAAQGNFKYVILFSIAALLILAVACFNFAILSTARSINRAKEVGMRKVLGAHRYQLIRQFLSESLLLTSVSLLISCLLVAILLPVFNSLAGKDLALSDLPYGIILIFTIGTLIVVGILAGSYPAFYLSAFSPVLALKGKFTRSGDSSVLFRKGLIIFQFAISSLLIIGTSIIYRQLEYIQNKNLGFDRENVLNIALGDFEEIQNFELLKQEWMRIPGVAAVTISSGIPTKDGLYNFEVIPEGSDLPTMLYTLSVDHDFPKTYGMELVEGRFFSEDYVTDATQAFLVNESAAKKLGWDSPINKEVTLFYYIDGRFEKKGRIIGVVKDFHYFSLHKKVDPVIVQILPEEGYRDFISIKIKTETANLLIASLQRDWQRFYPNDPFHFTFLDETIDALYSADQQLGRIFAYYSILGIFISCLGLYGMTSLTAGQRTKEIGIRKILGSGTTKIMLLLTKDYFLLVIIGFIAAVPVTYFTMIRWLRNFEYRVDIGLGLFLYVFLCLLSISLLTVLYHTVKIARKNPADAIRQD